MSEFKFKIGDKVKVRNDLIIDEAYAMENSDFYNTFEKQMAKYKGKIVTIDGFYGKEYFIREDGGEWGWTDEMFERYIMTEELTELNVCELIEDDYKYVIRCYEDTTEVIYMEKEIKSNKWEEKDKFNLCSLHDIQICEKIIELRKRELELR